ncbi:hypothetical protein [Actinocrispum wychmicini]|uniref:Uncharacterized protein n=1 Tax=Actinocrispum wychmicini TaxID=1213861 RepID=A0A4R2K0G0_9PSEU|nr:hypothetical protein [Actinocrispum wychmicini]TCO59805.1 hypothetical protein EV192_104648 [Actinocrispum wychmicini]
MRSLDNRDTDTDLAGEPSAGQAGPPVRDHTGLLALQTTAGNQAVGRALMVRREPNQSTVPADPNADPPQLARVKKLNEYIKYDPSGPREPGAGGERLFDFIHQNRSHTAEMEADYQKEFSTTVKADLFGRGVPDGVRGWAYWRFGELRPADKLFFTLYGTDFDLETMRRVLLGMKDKTEEADAIFVSEYQEHFAGITAITLPNKKTSLIAGILDSKWLKKKATSIEINALLAFGEFRPVDQMDAAMHTGTVSADWEGVLGVVQKTSDKPGLCKDFETYYPGDYAFWLGMSFPGDATDVTDLSLLNNKHEFLARMLLTKGEIGLNERVKLALKFKDDMSIVYNWIMGMSPEEKKTVRVTQINNEYLQEMDADDRERLRALLAENPTAVQRLQAAGADDSTKILKVLHEAVGDDRKMFADAYTAGLQAVGDPFIDLLVRKLGGDFGGVQTILTGTLDQRLRLAMQGMTDDEDYVFNLLEKHATTPERVDILKQDPKDAATLNGLMRNKLSAKEYAKALRMLLTGAEGMDPVERAKLTLNYSKEEQEATGMLDGSLNVYDAFKDEQRELRWAVQDAPTNMSPGPEDAAKLNALSSGVVASAESMIRTRDTLNDYAAQAIGLAVGSIIAYFTAGAGVAAIAELLPIFESVAVRVGVSAVARGMARVGVQRFTKGSSFDVFGNDGANAFAVGAIDGIVEVVAPSVIRGLVSKEYQDAMVMQGRKAAEAVWEGQKALHIKTALIEGASTEGFSSMVEAVGSDDTWRNGLSDGVMTTLAKGAQGGAIAAVGFAGIEVASPYLTKAIAKVQKLVSSGVPADVAKGLIEKEGTWVAARTGRKSVVPDVNTQALDEADIIAELKAKNVPDVDHAMRLIRDERKFIKEYNEMRKAHNFPVWDNMYAQPPGELLVDSLPTEAPSH